MVIFFFLVLTFKTFLHKLILRKDLNNTNANKVFNTLLAFLFNQIMMIKTISS